MLGREAVLLVLVGDCMTAACSTGHNEMEFTFDRQR